MNQILKPHVLVVSGIILHSHLLSTVPQSQVLVTRIFVASNFSTAQTSESHLVISARSGKFCFSWPFRIIPGHDLKITGNIQPTHVAPWLIFPVTLLCLILFLMWNYLASASSWSWFSWCLFFFFFCGNEPPRIQNMFLRETVNKVPMNKAPFSLLWMNGGNGVSFPSCCKPRFPDLFRLIVSDGFQLQIGLGVLGVCIFVPLFHNLRKYLFKAELTVTRYKYAVERCRPLHIHLL